MPKPRTKALGWLRQQCRNDLGVDVDHVVTDLVVLDRLIDDPTRGRPRCWQIRASGKDGAGEANTEGGELHRRGTVSECETIFYQREDQSKVLPR